MWKEFQCVPNLPDILDATEIFEIFHFQVLCSIQQVWNIKIIDIVTGENVRIDFSNEIRPTLEQVL